MTGADPRLESTEDGGTPPRHIAFIMDGNGRWAESRGLPRAAGHGQGAETLRAITRRAVERGVEEVTCYALSTENLLRRPPDEVDGLMEPPASLPRARSERDRRARGAASLHRAPSRAPRERAGRSRERGAPERGARSHDPSPRDQLREPLRAGRCRTRARRALSGGEITPEEIDEQDIVGHLYDPTMRDPDLLIRTAGEERISNFLLWQISYSELYFAPCPWPDFGPERLDEAIEAYCRRRRKYGGIVSEVTEDGGSAPLDR